MEQEQAFNQEYPRFSHMPNKAGPRLLEEQVREYEQLLEATLDMADLGIWKLPSGTDEVYCSAKGKGHVGYPATVKLTHATLEERIISAVDSTGKTVAEPGKIVQNMIERLQGQKVYFAIYQIKWPDDSIHWIEMSGKVLANKNGKASGIIGVTRDITERKQEQQRRDTHISRVRHELKTPLTTIKGFTQLLRRRIKKLGLDEQVEMLNRLEEQVDILNKLINEMRDVPQIQSQAGEGLTFRADQPFSLLSETQPSDSSYGGDAKNDT